MQRFSQDYSHTGQFAFVTHRLTWAVQTLILANIAVFAGQLLIDIPLGSSRSIGGLGVYPPGGELVLTALGFRCDLFLRGAVWQVITYQFLHAGLMHLFMNMLWLFFFGPDVERILGTRQFLRFYLLCGALGVLATFVPRWIVGPGYTVAVFGASGSVMGLLIAFAMTNPDRQFFLFPLPVPINARAMVVIIVALNIVSALGGGHTSVATHFGGMIAGYGYMKTTPVIRAWLLRRRRPPRPASRTETDEMDELGNIIDNIFDFEDRKRH